MPAERRAGASVTRAAAARLVLGTIVLTAFGLRLANFAAVTPNPFYDAAVRSMGQSWHNFFFGAFEPGGSVSVDKIPLDLWLQVLSVKMLGFGSVALRMPEALAGTLAVPLLYDTVRRVAGRPAGLAAAAALAVLPVAVLTARSDTMDSVMMALLVLAAWLTVRAAQSGRAGWLVGGGIALGVAFNVKMFEALLAAPALAALFLLGASASWPRRAAQLALAGAALAVTSLAWIVPASLTPPGSRPFPIGSTNGGIWNVVFVFNGSSRLRPPGGAAHAHTHQGLGRLFHDSATAYASLIGAPLAAALVLGLTALALHLPALLRREADPMRRLQRAAGVAVAIWLGTGLAVFGSMSRLHVRYLEAFTPAVAIALGAGAVALAWLGGRHRGIGLVLAAALAGSLVLEQRIAGAPSPGIEMSITIFAGLAAAACVVLVVLPSPSRAAIAPIAALLAVTTVLLAPAGRSLSVVRSAAADSGHPGHIAPVRLERISSYLARHSRGTRYEAAASSAIAAGPLIAHDARPVLILTTLYGRPLGGVATLRHAVATGAVRYALLRDGRCRPAHPGGAACAPAVRWARRHGADVSRRAGLPHRGTLLRLSLRPVPGTRR